MDDHDANAMTTAEWDAYLKQFSNFTRITPSALTIRQTTANCVVCRRRTLYDTQTYSLLPPKTCGRLACMITAGETKEPSWGGDGE